MTARTFSTTQRSLVQAIRAKLIDIGYSEELLASEYSFRDWFSASPADRCAPLAAFGQRPFSYDTACFSVLPPDSKPGRDLVQDFRALGAPFAFEVRERNAALWVVGKTHDSTIEGPNFDLGNIDAVFEAHRREWLPLSVLRAKNVASGLLVEQQTLFPMDDELVPALESRIREVLDPLLKKTCRAITNTYRQTADKQPNEAQMFKLAFWLLTAKVFHDRLDSRFSGFSADSDPDDVLSAVAQLYGMDERRLLNRESRGVAYAKMWSAIDLRNISTEILTFIWSNTFVSRDVRKRLGIHPTPNRLAKYVVDRLEFEKIHQDERVVVEPCCGSGTFLVAAMQRMRDLLPPTSEKARHNYFRERLAGFEQEVFGVEISRLRLTLADYPNPNHWKLFQGDIFTNQRQKIESALGSARIVLCNPPFEDFPPGRRHDYAQQPAEMLSVALQHLHPDGIMGFVLPRIAATGQSYKTLRQRLVSRFSSIEIVELPDVAFDTAQHESILLLAQGPHAGSRSVVVDRHVAKPEWPRFLRQFIPTREDRATKGADEAVVSLLVPPLANVWKHVRDLETIGSVVSRVHRGIEWNKHLQVRDKRSRKWVPTQYRDYFVRSNPPNDSFKLGIPPQAERVWAFHQPETKFLCLEPKYESGNSFKRPWSEAKVIVNAVRLSRGPWRLAAIADFSGLVFYQNFIGLWPREPEMANIIAAVINGPLANAFVFTRAGKHNTNKILRNVPFPRMAMAQSKEVDGLVEYYKSLMDESLLEHPDRDVVADSLLRQIDAIVLQGYDLPPRVERELLDFFRGKQRAVPFGFADYFPADFEPFFALHEYISPEFQRNTAAEVRRRFSERPPDYILNSIGAASQAFQTEE